MKTLIIFDLKETLIASDKTQKVTLNDIKLMTAKADLILYSIAEPWTYAVLASYPKMFAEFTALLLVRKKSMKDLRPYKQLYKNIVVAGDDEKAEIAFAKSLGYGTILVGAETNLVGMVLTNLQERKL